MRLPRLPSLFLGLVLLLTSARPLGAYSVLTHEEIIDLTWADSIQPLLVKRFPNLTPAQLTEAHAYAYGGCVIQDLGYYPFGKLLFSDLLHYVEPATSFVPSSVTPKARMTWHFPLVRSLIITATLSVTRRPSTFL